MSLTSRLIYNLTVVTDVVISYSQCMVWSPEPANPHPADHKLPHSGMGERIRRATVRKLVGQGIKAVLKMRGKGRRTQSKRNHFSLPTSRPVPSQPPKGGTLERPKPQLCGWAWHYVTHRPLWSAHGAVLAVPTPSLLPALWGTELRSTESLDALQACSATPQTLVCYQHNFSCKVQIAMT